MVPIKNLRIERGLTQKQLADILDVDRTTIVKYETGKNGPSSEQKEQGAQKSIDKTVKTPHPLRMRGLLLWCRKRGANPPSATKTHCFFVLFRNVNVQR